MTVRRVPGGTLRTRPLQLPFTSAASVARIGVAMSPAVTVTSTALTPAGGVATRACRAPNGLAGGGVLPALQPVAASAAQASARSPKRERVMVGRSW